MMRIFRPLIRIATAALALAAFVLAPTLIEAASQSPVNVLAGGRVAIHGYDPVAYFVEGGPRKGRSELAVERNGARWLFSSAANRAQFEADPERYLPAYGGYCAYGVAQGYLVKVDPEAWTIVDGRLYLNYDRSISETWRKDVPGYVHKADGNWPRLIGKP
ncbi:MAG: YHS domain-containing (seleno)protein [Microvirga sp.]